MTALPQVFTGWTCVAVLVVIATAALLTGTFLGWAVWSCGV